MKVTYTNEQRQTAIKTYKKLKSYSATLRVLGYPSRHVLFDWVKNQNHKNPKADPNRKPRHYSWRLKLEAVEALTQGQPIRDVAQELRIVSYPSIYEWVRIWRVKGAVGLMTKKEQIEEGIYKTEAQLEKALPDNPAELKKLAARLLAENAVLQEEIELAKKLPGGIPNKLPTKYKTQIINALRSQFPLSLLLTILSVKASSYYYACEAAKRPDKYASIRPLIHAVSDRSGHTYGSPRIWICLRNEGVCISEKVVRRLMKEEQVEVRYAKRRRKYSSYIGEITPAVGNIVKRNFHANSPNVLWLTDITEFSAADSKIYLSPIVDCFDGKIVSWKTSRNPDNSLVESMIDNALNDLPGETKTAIKDPDNPKTLTIHSDRGGHYRGGMWIEKLSGNGIIRSMSRKGNSGDNAACEGFFGRMKNEMYYGLRWDNSKDLEEAIANYIDFYNNERIKVSLGGVSIKEHRTRLAKVSRK